MIRFFIGWLIAAILAAALGAIAEGQLSLALLPRSAGPIGLEDRLAASMQNLTGPFLVQFGAMVGGALLPLMALAALIGRFASGFRGVAYAAAGAAAPLLVIAGLHMVFQATVVSGVTAAGGWLVHGLVGALAGLVGGLLPPRSP